MMYITHEAFTFNSHPHKEDDATTTTIATVIVSFNSHPHKEDDGLRIDDVIITFTFQLTSSQGG